MSLVKVLALVAAAAPGEDIPLRREAEMAFDVDEAFQAKGGVQYAFSLEDAVPHRFAALDVSEERSGRVHHVLLSRVVHTVDKDATFFTATRALDVDYMNAVAPGYDITALAPGRFHAGRIPANDFTLRFLDASAIAERAAEPKLQRVLELCGAGMPDSLVIQHNTAFSRVMGFRTADASFTWTAHYPKGRGRTQVCAMTMSYVVTLPPFFLGGQARMHHESVKETLALIKNLRAYSRQ